MVLEVQRTLKERAKLFVIAWAFGAFFGFVLIVKATSSSSHGPPIEGLAFGATIIGIVGAFATDAMVGSYIQAFRVARLGSVQERKAHLEKADGDASAGNALVAIEHGDLEKTARILDLFPAEKKNQTTTEELARLRYRLATESNAKRAKLVDEILDWRPSTFGAHALELERYAAFVVASHVERDLSDRTQAIARRLLGHGDEQVRGYGSWLALEIEDLPERASASADFGVGASLAKHHGRAELATLLDARASKLATGAAPSAYRD